MPEETPAQKRKAEARERAAYEKARFGSPSSQSAPFAKYSGKSAGKDPSTLHLAEFREEASGGEREEAGAVLEEYLQASGRGEWEKACADLTAELRAQIQQLAKDPGGGCGEALEAAIAALAAADPQGAGPAVLAPEGVASMRVQRGGRAGEGTGFALFRGSDGEDHWIAVKRQGGEWRVLSVTPQPFSASSASP